MTATEFMSMIETILKGCGARVTGTGPKIAIAPTGLGDSAKDGNGATIRPCLDYFPLY